MPKKWQIIVCIMICLSLLSACMHYKRTEFFEQFNDQKLNHKRWRITREGDFKKSIIDICDIDQGEGENYRLRLMANTIGTRDDTVKFHGVRCLNKIDFSAGKSIFVDLDWNNQENGCYLTAAIYICPTITEGNPKDERDWFRLEYIGVPPGKNARCAISAKVNNRIRHIYTEDWPNKKRGRLISYQKIGLLLDDQGFEVLENGKNLYGLESHKLNFSAGYLYLQMSSHSNYRSREIYFDNICIKRCKSIQNQIAN